LIDLLDNIYQISGIVLVICAVYYYFHFRKIKKERKLTLVELSVYVVTQVAFLLWAGIGLLLILDKNF